MRWVANPFALLGIQHVEDLVEEFVKVFPVFPTQGSDRVGEAGLLEDPRVLGEKAEQQSREEDVQIMDLIRGFDGVVLDDLVVELRHLLGSFDVCQIQVFDLRLLHPRPREEEGGVVPQLVDVDVERIAGI